MIAGLVAFLALAPAMHANAGISAQKALLSPHVHAGQTLTAFTTVEDYPVRRMHCQGDCHSDSRSLVIACSVESIEGGSISFTRRVRAFLPTQVSRVLEHSPIVMRRGRAFKPDGSALNIDPICPIYSADMWGNPTSQLRVGSIWHFQRNSTISFMPNLQGTVTVRSINAETSSISLHVATLTAFSSDMVVSQGGIVRSEVELYAFPYDELAVTTLQDRPLAGLWRIPPKEPVPFEVTGTPDIFNPNGNLISYSRLPLGDQTVTLIRIWHFGPFTPQSLFALLTVPKLSDWLLFCGVALLVVLISRAELMVVHMSNAGEAALPRVGRRRILLELGLSVAIAAACMFWVYR